MAKKMKSLIGAAIGGFAALVMGFSSIYSLNETQQAVVTAQGRPVRVYVGSFEAGQCDPERIQLVSDWADQNGYENVDVKCTHGFAGTGLHMKIPFWENVVKFPDQLVEYDSELETVQTKDKRQLIVDNYSKFYIENPLNYYLNVGRDLNAGLRKLDDIVYSVIRDNIATQDFNENIRTTNREVLALDGPVDLDTIEYGRENILSDIVEESHAQLEKLGLSLVDVRFIRVELPDQNETAVFDRMIAERTRIAKKYEAEGEAEYLKITSNADMLAAQTIADAQQQAGIMLGEGENEAAKIYTSASSMDPEFFSFWRTMKAYRVAYCAPDPSNPSACPGTTTLYLTTGSDFNKELENPISGAEQASPEN